MKIKKNFSLNIRINSILNDFKDQIQNQRKWIESQLSRSEQEQIHLTNQLFATIKDRLVSTAVIHAKNTSITRFLKKRLL